MQPPIPDRYLECRSCPHGKLCYNWKQGMPNVKTIETDFKCPVDGHKIIEAIGFKEEKK